MDARTIILAAAGAIIFTVYLASGRLFKTPHIRRWQVLLFSLFPLTLVLLELSRLILDGQVILIALIPGLATTLFSWIVAARTDR